MRPRCRLLASIPEAWNHLGGLWRLFGLKRDEAMSNIRPWVLGCSSFWNHGEAKRMIILFSPMEWNTGSIQTKIPSEHQPYSLPTLLLILPYEAPSHRQVALAARLGTQNKLRSDTGPRLSWGQVTGRQSILHGRLPAAACLTPIEGHKMPVRCLPRPGKASESSPDAACL